jgi:hypothetical protein
MEKLHPIFQALALPVFGLIVTGISGEIVAKAGRCGIPALFMGMIMTPAALEHESPLLKDEQSVLPRKGHSWHNRSYPVSRTGTRSPRTHKNGVGVFLSLPNQREILTA